MQRQSRFENWAFGHKLDEVVIDTFLNTTATEIKSSKEVVEDIISGLVNKIYETNGKQGLLTLAGATVMKILTYNEIKPEHKNKLITVVYNNAKNELENYQEIKVKYGYKNPKGLFKFFIKNSKETLKKIEDEEDKFILQFSNNVQAQFLAEIGKQ